MAEFTLKAKERKQSAEQKKMQTKQKQINIK